MGYVDISHPSLSVSRQNKAYTALAAKGVCYDSDFSAENDARADGIKNMWLKNGVLCARGRLADSGLMLGSGEVHGDISFFGYEIIHCGCGLYGVNETSCVLICDTLPDKNSLFALFSGKLYLYCDSAVYLIDRDLSIKEVIPYCPVYSNNCLRSSGIAPKAEGFVPNILAPCCRVFYVEGAADTDYSFTFPKIMDKSRIFKVYVDGKLLDKSEFEYDENAFYLNNDIYFGDSTSVEIRFFAQGEDFECCDIITGCTVACVYGGNTSEGTMVIVGGNPSYPGKYFYSEPASALDFKETLFGIAGNGNEDISAFSRQHSELIIFTPSTVSRMRYNYSSDTGGYFSVNTINSDIGCDVGKSVLPINNRTVFANSKKGIFIVDSTDNFDVMNIVRISGNITDTNGKRGYFSASLADRLKGNAVSYDGKYMLLCGDYVFIWDYESTPYTGYLSKNTESAFDWFEFDGFSDVQLLFSVGEQLFAVRKNEQALPGIAYLTDSGRECVYSYKSMGMGLSYPFSHKSVTAFRLGLICKKDTDLCVDFYADGKLYYSIKSVISPDEDGFAEFFRGVPKYNCKRFAFEIKSLTPGIGITEIGFDYIVKKG